MLKRRRLLIFASATSIKAQLETTTGAIMTALIPSTWDVPEIFRQRMGDKVGRQRCMYDSEHLLLILHEVPDADSSDRKGVMFWRRPDATWKTTARGTGLQALREVLVRYEDRIDELENKLREATVAKELILILRSGTPLVRASKHVKEVLQVARETIKKERALILLRDFAGENERAAELMYEEAKNVLEFEIAEQGELQAKLGHDLAMAGQRLNLLAALFLPVTALASIFGMNLVSGLEQIKTPLLFWGVLVGGMILGILVMWFLGVREKED